MIVRIFHHTIIVTANRKAKHSAFNVDEVKRVPYGKHTRKLRSVSLSMRGRRPRAAASRARRQSRHSRRNRNASRATPAPDPQFPICHLDECLPMHVVAYSQKYCNYKQIIKISEYDSRNAYFFILSERNLFLYNLEKAIQQWAAIDSCYKR